MTKNANRIIEASAKYPEKSFVFHILNTMRLKKGASLNWQKIFRGLVSKLISAYLGLFPHRRLIQKCDIPNSIFME